MRKITLLFFLAFIISSCGGVTSIPNPTTMPTPHLVPTNTSNAVEIMVAHPELEVITPENINRIELVDRWGKGMVYGIEISPDGSYIAVGTSTGIYFYDRITAKQIGFVDLPIASDIKYNECNMQEKNIAFSPDGKYLAVADIDIKVWDLLENKLYKTIFNGVDEPASIVTEIKFSSDGNRLITLQKERYSGYPCYIGWRSFLIYDVKTEGKIFQQDYSGTDESPRFFRLNKDNAVRFLYPSINGLEVSTVNLTDGDLLSQYIIESDYSVNVVEDIVISQDGGDQIATHFLDINTKSEIKTIYDKAVVLPITKYVLVGQRDFVLETLDEEKICTFANPDGVSSHLIDSYSKDGNLGVSWDYNRGEVRIWDFSNCTITDPILYFHESERELKFSPDGKSLLTNSRGGYGYFILDTRTGAFRYAAEPQNVYKVYDVDFSAGGSRVAVYSENYINEYDAITGSFLDTIFELQMGYLGGFIDFNENGDKIIYSDSSGTTFRNTLGNKEIIMNNVQGNIIFDHDGQKMLTFSSVNGGTSVSLMDADTGEELQDSGLIPSNYLWSPIKANQDLSLVASLDQDYVYLWTVSDFSLNRILTVDGPYNQKLIGTVMFSPDSRIFVGVAHDPNQILFWDVETGELLHHVSTTETILELGFHVDMSPDGRLLATLGNNGVIYIWGVRKK